MTQSNTSDLRRFIDQIRQRLMMIGTAAGFFWALTVAIVTVLIGVWFDLVWELPGPLRVASLVVAGVAAGVCFLIALATTFRGANAPLAARKLDDAADARGAIVTANSLDSAGALRAAHADTALTGAMSMIAIQRAADVAEHVAPASVAPMVPVRRAVSVCLSVIAMVAMAAVCAPSLAKTQWSRFANPFGDIPPYSKIKFDVEPGDTEVLFGGSIDVHASVTGGLVDEVELVYETRLVAGEHAGKQEVLPMFRESNGRWRAALSQLTEPATYYVRADRARSARYQIHVVTVPQIESLRFRLTPPAYTRDPVTTGPLPKAGLTGVKGTIVDVWATSNRPLSGGQLSLVGSSTQELPLTREGEKEVSGQFVITEDAQFTLSVKDAEGQSSLDPFRGTITLVEDHRPFVRIQSPRAMSVATPAANLPIAIAAEDDFGVSRMQLFRSLNNSRPLPLDLEIPNPPERRVLYRQTLPLAPYQLSPGDELKFFARVEDNDPVGAKGVESKIVTVRIISQEDFSRMAQRRKGMEVLLSKYRQAERRAERIAAEMEKLQKELEKQPLDSSAAKESREKLNKLSEQMEQAAAAIEAAAKEVMPFDIDKNLSPKLQDLADKIRQAAKDAKDAAENDSLTAKQLQTRLKMIAQQLSQGRKQFAKEALENVELLAAAMPLMRDQSRFEILVARQRDLADRLASLKGKDQLDDPAVKARMRDMEAEQLLLREELVNVLDAIESNVKLLPSDPRFDQLRESALSFVESVRNSGAKEAMSEAETAMSEFRGSRSHQKAEEAAQILERFLNQCKGMGADCKSACMKFSPGMGQCLGESMSQMLAAMGLKMGSGMGTGTGNGAGGQGGGYSARRSGGNIGMYGGLPAMVGAEGQGSGLGDSPVGSESEGGGAMRSQEGGPDIFPESAPAGMAAGVSNRLIPLRYRKRVGQYFQRVAEESATP